jgi:hypothetical protein
VDVIGDDQSDQPIREEALSSGIGGDIASHRAKVYSRYAAGKGGGLKH